MANPAPRVFKYPSEDEYLVRRLGSAVLKLWSRLPEDIQQNIKSEAANVWDREYGVVQVQNKLDPLSGVTRGSISASKALNGPWGRTSHSA